MSFLALEGSMPFLDCSSSFGECVAGAGGRLAATGEQECQESDCRPSAAFPQPNDFSSSSSLETGFVWDMGRSENVRLGALWPCCPKTPPFRLWQRP